MDIYNFWDLEHVLNDNGVMVIPPKDLFSPVKILCSLDFLILL